MTNSTPSHDEICVRAYEIYLREGCVAGRDVEHWLRAEQELRADSGRSNQSQSETPLIEGAPRSQRATQEGLLTSAPISAVNRGTTPRRSANKRDTAVAK